MQKFAQLAICTVIACVLLYFFPLVRVRKLEPGGMPSGDSHVQPDSHADARSVNAPPEMNAFIDSLWTERIPKAVGNANAVDDVLALATSDPSAARSKFGRHVGLGGPTFFFLRGRGKIESVSDDECQLITDGRSQRVVLEIGILVGNSVRDATGLVDVDDFSSSQDFNRLSSELNKRCESEVIGPIRNQLVVGAIVEFVGCGEVRNNDGFDPLKLIPVRLTTLDVGPVP